MASNLSLAIMHISDKSKRQPLLVLACLACLIAGPSLAQTSGSADDVFTQDLPLVLTASRLSQPVSEAPSAVTVIDRKMIAASGFRTVPELMRLVPGMYVGFSDASHPIVSLHGSADEFARRMQVLIDGRSAYMPPFGGMHWADLPLLTEDIERIEVVRGPSSASHGSNSFYGVINIISRDAADQAGTSVSVTGGHASDALARFGHTGGNFDYRVSLGYRSDKGLDNAVLYDRNATRIFNFRGNYHPSATDSLDVQLGSSEGVYGLGIEGRPEDAFRDTTARSDFQQIHWLHVWPGGDESKLTWSRSSRRSRDPYICIDSEVCQGKVIGKTRIEGFTARNVYSQRNELELQNTYRLGEHNRLVWGADVRSDYADFPLLFAHPYTVNPWQFFIHDEWRIRDAAVLNIGTMLEDDGMGNRSQSPRASVNYHVTREHTLRLGVSTATRSPVMSEAFIAADNTIWGGAYVPPVKALTPERVVSREIGYIGEFRDRGLSIEARLYSESVRNLIWWDKCAALSPCSDGFANLLAAEYRGLEVTAKFRWDEGRSFLVANYARQHASASLDALPTQYYDPRIGDLVKAYYNNEYLALFPESAPTNSGSILLSLALADSWRVSTGYYFRDQVRILDVSSDVTPEYSMHRIDMRLAKAFKFEQGRSAELAVVVQNVNRDDYTKYGTVNRVGEVPFTRRAWVTAALHF
ncbi:MAG: TonB-dependent receptor [Pseudomonadota bacterium]